MKRSILFMAALLGIAACARGPSLQSRMATFIGSSGENLVQNLGVPDKEITLNGFQYLAYIRQQTTITPSAPLFIGYGGFGPYGGPLWRPLGRPLGRPVRRLLWRGLSAQRKRLALRNHFHAAA
jgi:hypothetical protein